MQKLWRIAAETKHYAADDMSGAGSGKDGGRWNSPGNAVLYTSGSIALACLETLVHMKLDLPLNRYLVCIKVPDDIWNSRVTLTVPYPVRWDAEPAGITSANKGDAWIKANSAAIFEVPSVIVPEESNFLINPKHLNYSRISAKKIRRWLYSPRLRLGI